MSKRRRKRRNRHIGGSRRRRRNPFIANPRHSRSYRRRRNPQLALPIGEVLPLAGWAVAGGVLTRAVPQMLLKEGNTGVMGYGANVATAVLGSWLARQISPNAAKGVLIGGAVAIVQRAVAEFFGPKVLDVGMSGDLDFDLGYYIPNSFPVPTTGRGPFLLQPGVTGGPMMAGGVPGNGFMNAPDVTAAAVGLAPSADANEPGRWATRWSA